MYGLFERLDHACDAMARLDLQIACSDALSTVHQARDDLLIQLRQLKDRLDDLFEQNDVGLVMFGLTIYLDEHILTRLFDRRPQDWPLLQKQFLRIRNGGEDFFLKADYILQTRNVSPFVWEVYYFCLKRGFCGRYYGHDDRIEYYKKQLELKIVSNAATNGAT